MLCEIYLASAVWTAIGGLNGAIARNQRLPGWLVQPEWKVFCTSKPAWPSNVACSEQTLIPAGQAGTGRRFFVHVL